MLVPAPYARSAWAGLLLSLLLLGGCASGAKVTRGGGSGISAAQFVPPNGPQYRIAVAPVIDKTDPLEVSSLRHQLTLVNLNRDENAVLTEQAFTSAVQDMLTTELFQSEQFIVLERAAIDAAMVEQEFSQSAAVDSKTSIPLGDLEGAELLVMAAITGFDAGTKGGAVPIPIPLGGDWDNVGLINLSFSKGWVTMDVRVVDTRTGRVVRSVAVEGQNSKYGMNLSFLLSGRRHGYQHVKLPGLLDFFKNTPVEQALQKMVTAAVQEISLDAGRPVDVPNPQPSAE